MIRTKLLFALLLFCSITIAQTVNFTLNECIQYAFGNSYTRKTMLLNEESQSESLKGAKASLTPSVSASLGESLSHRGTETDVNFGGNINVGANITLYNGGSLRGSIKQSELQLEQSKAQTAQYDQNLTIQIVQQFITILGQRELIKYQEQLLSTSQQQMEEGKRKFAVGAILESDFLLLEAQHATNETNLLDSKSSLSNSLLALKCLLSMDPLTNFDIIEPEAEVIESMRIVPTQEEAIDGALKNMPDMQLSENSLAIAQTSLKIARSGYIPSISASASVGTSHSNFNNFGNQIVDNLSQNVGISVSIPIYDRSQTRTRVRQAKLAINQAELEHQQTELDIRQTIVQTYLDVMTSIAKYDSNTKKSEAWRKTFDAYSAQFRLGAITTVELLQQQNSYISALNDYIQAKYNFMLKREILNIYMGN